MKAVVLGATGFIGLNVLRTLHALGHDVVGTRRTTANTLWARKIGAPLVRAELDDPGSLVEAMRGRDVAFLCAAHYPRYSLDATTEVATARRRARNALTAAARAGVGRLVLTSSIATVGPPRPGRTRVDEDDAPDPRAAGSVYHQVKLAIEDELRGAAGAGVDVVTLLPTAVLGELDVKAGTGFLVVAVGQRRLPFYVEGRINVVDADDLAAAHVAAAERGRPGARYVVAGHDLLVSELLARVGDLLGVPFDSVPIPAWLGRIAGTFAELSAAGRPGARPFLSRELVDVVRLGQFVDRDKSARALALPPPTPLAVTLEKACAWYRRHRYLPEPQGTAHARVPRTDHP